MALYSIEPRPIRTSEASEDEARLHNPHLAQLPTELLRFFKGKSSNQFGRATRVKMRRGHTIHT